jgi:hypothetical protein
MKEKRTAAELERLKTRTLVILSRHAGACKIIGMGELYEEVFEQTYRHRINDTRQLRIMITGLRRDGVPIVSVPSRNGGGYYLAAAGSELEDYLSKQKRRALGILACVARIKNKSLPELLGQMALNLQPRDIHDKEAA